MWHVGRIRRALPLLSSILMLGSSGCPVLGTGSSAVPGFLDGIDSNGSSGIYVGISAGSDHVCAITAGGNVYCWGDDRYGQLGIGDPVLLASAIWASGISSASAVANGQNHSCAIESGTGTVYCWGQNDHGQLGDGTTITRAYPVSTNVSGAVSVAVGSNHSCAVTNAGAVYCWGMGSSGQIGNNSVSDQSLPYRLASLTGTATSVTAGDAHTCAVLNGGTMQCWGSNTSGQIGNGTSGSNVLGPAAVTSVSAAVSASAGSAHTCVRTSSGGVQCWGSNSQGQIGNGSTGSNVLTPFTVGGMNGVQGVAAGGSHTCMYAGTNVMCWGNGAQGQLGQGSSISSPTPVTVTGLPSAYTPSFISAGGNTTCVASSGGTYCWGDNTDLQTGNGDYSTTSVLSGANAAAFGGTSSVSVGGIGACALSVSNLIYCWGWNQNNQLETGELNREASPTSLGSIGGVTQLSAGGDHTCAISGGHGYCWGWNKQYQLGDGTQTQHSYPTQTSDYPFVQISAGGSHSCGVDSSGTGYCWGQNDSGQLGLGTTGGPVSESLVQGLGSGTTRKIVGGSNFSCALLTSGNVSCWGSNTYGQLGDGTVTTRGTPQTITSPMSNVVDITAGNQHVCAIDSNGAAWCWGNNANGQIGNNSATGSQTTPVQVAAPGTPPGKFKELSAGGNHTCGILTDGSAWCWGGNSYGQVGDGTVTQRNAPTKVINLTSADHIAAGNEFSCATQGSAIRCWGHNTNGKLGVGDFAVTQVTNP